MLPAKKYLSLQEAVEKLSTVYQQPASTGRVLSWCADGLLELGAMFKECRVREIGSGRLRYSKGYGVIAISHLAADTLAAGEVVTLSAAEFEGVAVEFVRRQTPGIKIGDGYSTHNVRAAIPALRIRSEALSEFVGEYQPKSGQAIGESGNTISNGSGVELQPVEISEPSRSGVYPMAVWAASEKYHREHGRYPNELELAPLAEIEAKKATNNYEKKQVRKAIKARNQRRKR